jgi:hypothetical protein
MIIEYTELEREKLQRIDAEAKVLELQRMLLQSQLDSVKEQILKRIKKKIGKLDGKEILWHPMGVEVKEKKKHKGGANELSLKSVD